MSPDRHLVLLPGLLLLAGAVQPGSTTEAPLIAYQQGGGRGLVMVNNPEYVQASHLAGAGQALYRERLAAGAWRYWSSHFNATDGAIRQRVWLHNPGSEAATVTLETAAHGDRGKEFIAAFNASPATEPETIAAGASLLLHATPTIKKGFFGAVIDWTADRPLELIAAVARPAADIDATALEPVGYVTSTARGGKHREARVYKGSNPNSVAELELHWTIDDADTGILPVQVRRFDAESGYGEAQISTKGWLTHICIGHREKATMSDLFTWACPSHPRPIDPAKPSDALDMFPNVGNWGVVYRHHGQIVNTGERDRQLVLQLRGKGLELAAQSSPEADWRRLSFSKGSADWLTLTLPAGSTTAFDARLVLGGPANGAIWHRAVLLD